MGKSKTKYNRGLYIVLLLTIIAFIGFSVLPVLSNSVGQNRSLTKTEQVATTDQTTSARAKLEMEAKGYQLVLQREPSNETALRGFLDTQLNLGNIQETIEPLQKLAELHPDDLEYRTLLALTKEKVGDLLGAAQEYRLILAEDPRNNNALIGMANLLLRQDRPEASIKLVEDAIQNEARINSPESQNKIASLQLLLGQIYSTQKRYPEAIAVYDQVIDSNQEDFRPFLAKATILREQGQDKEAKLFFSTAKELAPPEYQDYIQKMILVDS